MSKNATLKATKRESSGSSAAKRLRRDGIVPAVIYGANQDNYSIQLEAKAISDLLKQSASENILVNLEIEGAKEKAKMAMIQAVQQDSLTRQIVHVDFHAVHEGDKLTAHVPIILLGEAAGVRHGGLLDHQLHALDVHCIPANLPDHLEIDVSALEIGDAAHVSDLVLPDGVEVLLDGDVVVAIVQEIKAIRSEEAAAAEAEEAGEGGEAGEAAGEGEEAAAE